jgi:hypothetical protein
MDLFILAACSFTVLVMGAALYSFTRRVNKAELRMLGEARRASADARDAAAMARADVDGLRRELEDALGEVAGKFASHGMDVTTGVDDDELPTDPRFELPGERSGVVAAFPRRPVTQ